MFCPSCGVNNRDTAGFCKKCGVSLREFSEYVSSAQAKKGKVPMPKKGITFCTNCGAENRDTAKFCKSCGSALIEKEEQVPPPKEKPRSVPLPAVIQKVIKPQQIFTKQKQASPRTPQPLKTVPIHKEKCISEKANVKNEPAKTQQPQTPKGKPATPAAIPSARSVVRTAVPTSHYEERGPSAPQPPPIEESIYAKEETPIDWKPECTHKPTPVSSPPIPKFEQKQVAPEAEALRPVTPVAHTPLRPTSLPVQSSPIHQSPIPVPEKPAHPEPKPASQPPISQEPQLQGLQRHSPVSMKDQGPVAPIPPSPPPMPPKAEVPVSKETPQVRIPPAKDDKIKAQAMKMEASQPGDSIADANMTFQDGRYVIVKRLGMGGTGRIFLARDTKMGADVVLKELHPVNATPETLKYLEKRFMEEAKLLFRLTHVGFPRVIDYFTERDRLLIIMQYIEGKNLYSLLMEQPEKRFSLDQCIDWFGKMLDLLIILQSQVPPIIHRDIKPANIMLDKDGNLYLVDFGFAKTLDPDGPQTRVGTYGYASPEHYSGKFVMSSDIFSLGATFHHLLTGQNPQARKDPFNYPPIKKFVPDFPDEFQKIFDKMLSLSKAFRYSNAMEVKVDFDKFKENYKRIKGKLS